MRFQSYFNSAIKIIQLYDGTMPLQHFLKQYFSQHKKHGSRDRKIITHVCYNFFRLGKAFSTISAEERLKLAIFICNDNIENWKFLFEGEWLNNHNNLEKRIAFVQSKYSFSLQDVFPFYNEASKPLDNDAFAKAFFIQPDVFLRIRPGFNNGVINKLQSHNIQYNIIEESCIGLAPSTNINSVIDINKEAVIQDYASQQVGSFLYEAAQHLPAISYQVSAISKEEIQNRISVWDCCAGSGGKSILAYDVLKNIELTASDIRSSIIQNLKQRFAKAGIKKYKTFVYDAANSQSPIPNSIFPTPHASTNQLFNQSTLTNSKFPIPNSPYDLIICDAPCTGSGTWGRTPEQLYFFNVIKIEEYAARQQKIVRNAVEYLKTNGFFLYITCSVFEKENEATADFIQQKLKLELIKLELIKGYGKKADTMFAALFKKN
ncbi:16S rRNA (cytosine967-C5)-methyltransferase [Parafilimonas terrae]|uniref:16S rRNA (Cytosine967-C5)-methyltransferase n=2 Tax=Parafilimonas terrae TaxID=1465490 RepID=A0A1I5WML9_9BACT|nr:16S rRNA (cytosine967-C5)-methyltransferase [Parafilimonas terrae]